MRDFTSEGTPLILPSKIGGHPVNCFQRLAAALSGALLCACSGVPHHSAWRGFEFVEPEMGVDFTIKYFAPNEAAARKAAREVFARIEALNQIFSDYEPTSEINRLCQAIGRPVTVSPELGEILRHAQRLAQETHGAFDVTVGPYTQLWRQARRQGKLPDTALLRSAAESVGYQKLRLAPDTITVTILDGRMRLDLGGIAKGWAADEALTILRRHGFHRALCAAGGDIALGDPPPGKSGWPVEVPALDRQGTQYLSTFTLSNCGVSTSGDTVQFFEVGGKRYSHIIDPRTGLGLTTRLLVTVIARNATEADGHATAITVLGAEDGLAFANGKKLRAQIIQLDAKPPKTLPSSRWSNELK